jgi:hypothetical protein
MSHRPNPRVAQESMPQSLGHAIFELYRKLQIKNLPHTSHRGAATIVA